MLSDAGTTGHTAVQVWIVPHAAESVGAVGVDLFPHGSRLSGAERRRAARFRQHADRRTFTVTRSALRQILGAALGCRPGEVVLDATAHGKPILVDGPTVHFNVTHARSRSLIAVHPTLPVGVDLEERDREVGLVTFRSTGSRRPWFLVGERINPLSLIALATALGEDLEVAVRLRADASVTGREVIQWAGTQLTAVKAPRYVHVLDEIPKTSRGKVNRQDVATHCAGQE